MGGSSLAPEVYSRAFDAAHVRVLDTTHPAAIRRLAAAIDPSRTLFVVSSKSGGTIETRSQFDFFHELTGADGGRFVVITDPGSALESLADERGARSRLPRDPVDRRSLLRALTVRARATRADRRRRRGRARPGAARPSPRVGCARRRRTRGSRSASRSPTAGATAATRCASTRLGSRSLARAAARRVDREAGEGSRPGARRERRRRGSAGPLGHDPRGRRRWAPRCSAGRSRPPSWVTCSGSTRSTSPTCRRRRTARASCSRPGTVPGQVPRRQWTSCSTPHDPATTSRSRRSSTRPGRASSSRSASARTRRAASSPRSRAPVPALDRAAPQGRARHGHLRPGRRRHR